MNDRLHSYVFISVIVVIGLMIVAGIFLSTHLLNVATSVNKISGAITSSFSSEAESSYESDSEIKESSDIRAS